jgi:MoaA/NifB/PqqE/SkfB family radical SAM enzyme
MIRKGESALMKKRILSTGLGLYLFLLSGGVGYGKQVLVAQKVTQEPIIDGKATDSVWSQAQAITTHDKIADIDITLKAVYTEEKIFFLVTFPDKDESRTHRNWVWNFSKKEYEQGKDREDVFVLKWNMNPQPVDLSIYADRPYLADIWFWKACRTDPLGYADDKLQRLNPYSLEKAKELISKSGRRMYLQRLGDQGCSTYKTNIHIEYKGDVLPRYTLQPPTLSRGDIKAKGLWEAGRWTIEFARLLTTGHADDIQFEPEREYQFGVSRYEIAGRKPEVESTQPLYGCGDVSEDLSLKFSRYGARTP